MSYIDGFVLPLPKKKVETYRKVARQAAKVWKEYGALAVFEAVGEDLKVKGVVPFTKLAKAKPGETVVFSWIVFKSRAHRDRVNARVLKDPRMANAPVPMPFDGKRMAYGGFQGIVEV